ncbi:hypothetical protein [Tahibacter harae]|uniref:Uncharacterized protein n=1 Tax=Tahibacter harae TaxID=2963937 RepID=A0ABT1QS23_9GAMM|nr:hypothetical protein [Tahibacter harae]MCQ4165057.1 hypothetical protein [Tahibacter harae]
MNPRAQRCTSELIRLVLVCATVWLSLALPQVAAQAGVQISLHLDADSVELIRALRRAQGLDPPDAEADRRVAALLGRRQAERRQSPQSRTMPIPAAPAPAAELATTMLTEAAGAADASLETAPAAVPVDPPRDAATSAAQDQPSRRPRP